MAYGIHSKGLHFIAGAPAWHARMSNKEISKNFIKFQKKMWGKNQLNKVRRVSMACTCK